MLDIQFIRDNAELVKQKSKQKGYDIDVDNLIKKAEEYRKVLQEIEDNARQRNIYNAQFKSSKPTQEQIEKGKVFKGKERDLFTELNKLYEPFVNEWKRIPNMPLDDVPIGASESENQITKTWGEKPKFDFKPKTHAEIAETKGWVDKERAAKVTGSRFAYIKGDMVHLQFAIIQFVFSKLTDRGFIQEIIDDNNLGISDNPFVPVLPPYMLRTDIYDAMDRLDPREDRYKIDGEDLWLQGSAEHVLGSMHADEILREEELPLRYIGYATSFRREAGNYGKDTEGIFRMHQFDKLEMESLTLPENGLKEHLLLIAIQEKLMQLLQIPYEVIKKCTADIGKPNASGVDINAWLPGQTQYRETHTADYMTDYQARRLKTRIKRTIGGDAEFVHTNDATAFALSRTPIAIIENYQDKDGNVLIPKALQKYLGKDKI